MHKSFYKTRSWLLKNTKMKTKQALLTSNANSPCQLLCCTVRRIWWQWGPKEWFRTDKWNQQARLCSHTQLNSLLLQSCCLLQQLLSWSFLVALDLHCRTKTWNSSTVSAVWVCSKKKHKILMYVRRIIYFRAKRKTILESYKT